MAPDRPDTNGSEPRHLRMKGVLFGHAVGDALGLGGRFLTREEMLHHYPNGLSTYDEIARLDHLRLWRRGDWTDATGQMLCVLDTLRLRGRIVPETLARLLHDRQADGGFNSLKQLLEHPLFLLNPLEAARDPVRGPGGILSDNSAVKRASIIGIWNSEDLSAVKANAEVACLVTHPRPDSVNTCIAIACAIAELVQGKTVAEAIRAADLASRGAFAGFFSDGINHPIATCRLDEASRSDAPEKALFAGFHALKHADSFLDGLRSVIGEGGDAAANGAVAGALLGARFGFTGIPTHLVRGLNGAAELDERLHDLEARQVAGIVDEPAASGDEDPDRAKAIRSVRWMMRLRAWWAVFLGFLSRVAHLPAAATRCVTRSIVWLLAFLTGWITEDVFSVEDSEGNRKVLGFDSGPARDLSIFALAVLLILGFGLMNLWSTLANLTTGMHLPTSKDIMRALQTRVASEAARDATTSATSTVASASHAPASSPLLTATRDGCPVQVSQEHSFEAGTRSMDLLPETASHTGSCALCGRPFDTGNEGPRGRPIDKGVIPIGPPRR